MNAPASTIGTDRLGRPLRDLRISVTDRCNFRCPYCMPIEVYGDRDHFMPRTEILSYEEIERIARIVVGAGARKIRITGGEPLLRRDLHRLVERLARLDGLEDLALTTNGYLLAERAQRLAEAGLRRVTVSLDSLDDKVFREMNGLGFDPARVLAGIEAADRAGLNPVKINCVVQRGLNDHTVVDLARHFKGTGMIVRFIEFMDVGTVNRWNPALVVTGREIVARISAELPLRAVPPEYPGEVASRWAYVDGGGEIGVVTSVSEPFCRGCTRARLSTDGKLVTCLFARSGLDLKGPLRAGASDDEIRKIVAKLWSARSDRYSEKRAMEAKDDGDGKPRPKIEMFQIGG